MDSLPTDGEAGGVHEPDSGGSDCGKENASGDNSESGGRDELLKNGDSPDADDNEYLSGDDNWMPEEIVSDDSYLEPQVISDSDGSESDAEADGTDSGADGSDSEIDSTERIIRHYERLERDAESLRSGDDDSYSSENDIYDDSDDTSSEHDHDGWDVFVGWPVERSSGDEGNMLEAYYEDSSPSEESESMGVQAEAEPKQRAQVSLMPAFRSSGVSLKIGEQHAQDFSITEEENYLKNLEGSISASVLTENPHSGDESSSSHGHTGTGERQTNINIADGKNSAVILASESAKVDQVNRAQGEAEAIIAQAQGTAKGIDMVSQSLEKSVGVEGVSLKIGEQHAQKLTTAKQVNTVSNQVNIIPEFSICKDLIGNKYG